MNARLQPKLRRRAMTVRDIDAVQAIEAAAYSFPWTRGNFIDSLAAGYLAEVLEDDGVPLGYFVAMAGVDELHLLNITVAPPFQGQGHGQLLLEVRRSNPRAQALYRRCGFVEVGLRRGYYPALQGREDAIVMSLSLAATLADGREVPHGLV